MSADDGCASQEVTLAWACQTLAQGDPDGHRKRSRDFGRAWLKVWAEAGRLGRGSLNRETRGLQRRMAQSRKATDVISDVQCSLIDYIQRQGPGRCTGIRFGKARKIATAYQAGQPNSEKVATEALRWARWGLAQQDLLAIWGPAGIPLEWMEEAWRKGVEEGEKEAYWRNFLRMKMHSLILDRQEELNDEQNRTSDVFVEEVGKVHDMGGFDPGRVAALVEEVSEEWFLLGAINPALVRFPGRKNRILAFREYFLTCQERDEPFLAGWLRKANRGRDDVCEALFQEVLASLEAAPEALARLTETIRMDLAHAETLLRAELARLTRALETGKLSQQDWKRDSKRLRNTHDGETARRYRQWVQQVAGSPEIIGRAAEAILALEVHEIQPLGAFNNDFDVESTVGFDLAHGVLACVVMMTDGRMRNPKSSSAADGG